MTSGIGSITVGGSAPLPTATNTGPGSLSLESFGIGTNTATNVPVNAPVTMPVATPTTNAPITSNQNAGGNSVIVGSGNDFVPGTRVSIGANGQLVRNDVVGGGGGNAAPAPTPGANVASIRPQGGPAEFNPFFDSNRHKNPIIDYQAGLFQGSTAELQNIASQHGSTVEELIKFNPHLANGSPDVGQDILIPVHDVVNSGPDVAVPAWAIDFMASKGADVSSLRGGSVSGGGPRSISIDALQGTSGGGAQQAQQGAAAQPAAPAQSVGSAVAGGTDLASLQALYASLTAMAASRTSSTDPQHQGH